MVAPIPVFEAVAVAMLFAAVEELISLFTASGIRVPHWPSVLGALLTLMAFSDVIGGRQLSLDVILMVELIALALVALAAWRGGPDALGSTSASLFPSLYLAIPIGAMVAIRESGGPAALSLLMLTVIVSDSAQYYTGRMLGRRLLAPAISPKKTIEGAIGGLRLRHRGVRGGGGVVVADRSGDRTGRDGHGDRRRRDCRRSV